MNYVVNGALKSNWEMGVVVIYEYSLGHVVKGDPLQFPRMRRVGDFCNHPCFPRLQNLSKVQHCQYRCKNGQKRSKLQNTAQK